MKPFFLKNIRPVPRLRRLVCAAVLGGSMLISSAYALTLAEVNKIPISEGSVNEALQSYLRQIGHRELSAVRMASLRIEVLTKLIEEELLYQDALKSDLNVTEEEIEAGVLKIRNRFKSTQDFDEALSKKSLKLKDIKNGVARSVVIQKSWERFSDMSESDRLKSLAEMTQGADIQIYEDLVPVTTAHE